MKRKAIIHRRQEKLKKKRSCLMHNTEICKDCRKALFELRRVTSSKFFPVATTIIVHYNKITIHFYNEMLCP